MSRLDGPGPVRIAALGWGVSNAVLAVETPERLFVLKQSRPQLATRDAWFSDIERVYRELEVMQTLHPLLPPGVVPKVLHVDRPKFTFAMEHAAPRFPGLEGTTAARRGGTGPRSRRRTHPRYHPSRTRGPILP